MRRLGAFVMLSVMGQSLAIPVHALGTTTSATCEGGFMGTLSEGATSVGFESCPTGSKVHAEIRDETGKVVIEVDIAPDALVTHIGGIALAEGNTETELNRMKAALDTAEASLVSRRLWPALLRAGHTPAEKSMAAIASILTLYGGLSPRSLPLESGDDCFGCCGPGCWGCTGCYTSACAAHDACVKAYGAGNNLCQQLLIAAALSAWCCQGVHLGPLCLRSSP